MKKILLLFSAIFVSSCGGTTAAASSQTNYLPKRQVETYTFALDDPNGITCYVYDPPSQENGSIFCAVRP